MLLHNYFRGGIISLCDVNVPNANKLKWRDYQSTYIAQTIFSLKLMKNGSLDIVCLSDVVLSVEQGTLPYLIVFIHTRSPSQASPCVRPIRRYYS